MPPRVALVALAALVRNGLAAGARPESPVNITIYHVNPLEYGVIPFNMDVGDAAGDLYFVMRSVVSPIECAEDPTAEDCTDAEVTASTLVTSKLVVEIDSRTGGYGHCNICTKEYQQGWPRCKKLGEYFCYGTHNVHKVGYELPNETHSESCSANMKDWECWRNRVAAKFGGQWWSFFNQSYCAPSAVGSSWPGQGCAWRVVSSPRVANSSCVLDKVYSSIEAHGAACFGQCTAVEQGRAGAASGTPAAAMQLQLGRNVSDPCWIKCLYTTVLGPGASDPAANITGMPLGDIVQAWDGAFEEGGCPAVPVADQA